MLKSQARREKINEMNPSNSAFLASDAIKGFGIASEILNESEEKVSIKVKRCPVYEAAKMMGFGIIFGYFTIPNCSVSVLIINFS